jgi:hypothetical protein
MSIGLVVIAAMVAVGMVWTSVLLIAAFLGGIRQRRRIETIAQRIDSLLETERQFSHPGRHRLRGTHHA